MSCCKIILGLADFKACLSTEYINPSNFSPAVAKQYSELSSGAFVVALKGFETNVAKKMFLTMWRCRDEKGTVMCLVAKVELEGMRSKLRAFGGDDGEGDVAMGGV